MERNAFRDRGKPWLKAVAMLIGLQLDLVTDPVFVSLIAAVLSAAVGAVVKVLTERVLNRWVPEPRLAKPEPEYIL
jgi:tetrahydromethanopterin S-methyltransferase subunit C